MEKIIEIKLTRKETKFIRDMFMRWIGKSQVFLEEEYNIGNKLIEKLDKSISRKISKISK